MDGSEVLDGLGEGEGIKVDVVVDVGVGSVRVRVGAEIVVFVGFSVGATIF
jgi:hypothetical protein